MYKHYLHVVALSAHLRVCGRCYPRVPGPLVSSLQPSFLSLHIFSVYGAQFHTVEGERDEFVRTLSKKCTFHFPFSHSIFFTCPARRYFVPHISTIVPSPLMLPSCMIFWITFHHFCSQGMPPSRASPSINIFRVSIAALGPSSQTQSFGTPHAFCKYFIQKKVNPSVSKKFLAILHVLA